MRDRGTRFILPAVLVLLFVTVFPLLFSLYLSFTDSTVYNIYNAPFVGFKNYIKLFQDVRFHDSIVVTLKYVVFAVFIEFILGFLLALLIDSLPKGQKIFMVLLIIPIMISPLMYGIMFKLFYNGIYGLVPWMFRSIGLNISLLNKGSTALNALIAVDVFQWTSFIFLILYAGLKSLPKEPIEAAKIDGANYKDTVKYIIIPLLRPVIAIALIFRTMDAIKTFDQVFVITSGGPGTATTTLSMYTYFLMFTRFDFGKAAALTVVIIVIITFITKFYLKLFYREVQY